jgi:hypothetical protein
MENLGQGSVVDWESTLICVLNYMQGAVVHPSMQLQLLICVQVNSVVFHGLNYSIKTKSPPTTAASIALTSAVPSSVFAT